MSIDLTQLLKFLSPMMGDSWRWTTPTSGRELSVCDIRTVFIVSKGIRTVIDDDADVACVSLAQGGLWLIARCTFTLEQAGSTLAAIALESLYFCGGERLENGGRRGDTGAGIVGDGAGDVNSELRAVGIEEDSEVGCSAGKKRAVRVLNRRVQDSISHGVKRRHGKDPIV